jgi:DNA repair protein RecN (Recombination protein N)
MLTLLELRDFAIISELRLELAPGLNAFTGETGAGKSILVDALLQLTGARADTGFIRAGMPSSLVQGEFSGGEVTSLARRLQAGGRSTARINGEVVLVGELSERASELIAIHGQHAALSLSDSARQQRLLDRLLTPEGQEHLQEYQRVFDLWRATETQLRDLTQANQERARRFSVIEFQLNEIEAAALKPGEQQELLESLSELRNAEAIVTGSGMALALLNESDRSILVQLDSARRHLDHAARYSEALAILAAELRSAHESLHATTAEVEAFIADFNTNPAELEKTEQRLALIESVQRKYGDTVEEVLAFGAALKAEHEALQNSDEDIAQLQARIAELKAQLQELAVQVAQARVAAAERLVAGVSGFLGQLGMPAARFAVRFDRFDRLRRSGPERSVFEFSANAGEPLAELAAVASGGELSRVLLAVNLVAGAEQPTVVFDEVDAGTGGRAAVAIGSLLHQLARDRQVLVVTHLPQVAAFAQAQYQVEKHEQDGRTVTSVKRLEGQERISELARMLSGSVTDASLTAARELLSTAGALEPK